MDGWREGGMPSPLAIVIRYAYQHVSGCFRSTCVLSHAPSFTRRQVVRSPLSLSLPVSVSVSLSRPLSRRHVSCLSLPDSVSVSRPDSVSVSRPLSRGHVSPLLQQPGVHGARAQSTSKPVFECHLSPRVALFLTTSILSRAPPLITGGLGLFCPLVAFS